MSKRLAGRFGYPADDPFRVTAHEDKWDTPFKIKQPKKIFVCSMGDLFHEDVPTHWIHDVFATMGHAHWHTFMVLTKRADRMEDILDASSYFPDRYYEDFGAIKGSMPWPLPNVWLGVTVEEQKYDYRIRQLLNTPAALRFVSCEPLLGPIEFGLCTIGHPRGSIGWVIVGAETGPGARWMDPLWAASIRDQCRDAGVPFFMKNVSGRETIPEDLLIREFPNGV